MLKNLLLLICLALCVIFFLWLYQLHNEKMKPVRTPPRQPVVTEPAPAPAPRPAPVMEPQPTPATEPLPQASPVKPQDDEPTTMQLRELEAALVDRTHAFTVDALKDAKNGHAVFKPTVKGLTVSAEQKSGKAFVDLKGTVHLIGKNTFAVDGTMRHLQSGKVQSSRDGRFTFKSNLNRKGWVNKATGMLIRF